MKAKLEPAIPYQCLQLKDLNPGDVAVIIDESNTGAIVTVWQEGKKDGQINAVVIGSSHCYWKDIRKGASFRVRLLKNGEKIVFS